MKGNPFKELVLVAVFFLAMLIPMLRLTGLHADAPLLTVEDEHRIAVLRESWATFRFAHRPEKCVLTVNGIALWTILAPEENRIDQSIPLPIEQDRVEVLVSVTWPEGTPETVCELTLEPDGLPGQQVSVWGSGSIEELLLYHWEAR